LRKAIYGKLTDGGKDKEGKDIELFEKTILDNMKAKDATLATKTYFDIANAYWNRKVDEERLFKDTWEDISAKTINMKK